MSYGWSWVTVDVLNKWPEPIELVKSKSNIIIEIENMGQKIIIPSKYESITIEVITKELFERKSFNDLKILKQIEEDEDKRRIEDFKLERNDRISEKKAREKEKNKEILQAVGIQEVNRKIKVKNVSK